MPRAKVKPEDRKRSVAACSLCKLSKIRCDSKSPCDQCVRRGRGAKCEYRGSHPYHRSAGRSSRSAPRSPASANGPPAVRQSSVTHSPSAIPVSQDPGAGDDADDDDDVPIPSTKRAPGRVLFSSAGEQSRLRWKNEDNTMLRY
jgi:Fungal Zn(2)-Cys(6) binuclear cluster domain